MQVDINKIVSKFNLNDIEEKILVYVIENIKDIKKLGVRGLAEKHYTSTTTIMNLAKKLGYSGFLDMYYNLNFMLKNKNEYVLKSNNKYSGIDLDELLSLISYKDVEKFITLLKDNKKEVIYTLGQGFSIGIVQYITKKLVGLGFKCIYSDSYESYDVNPIKGKILITISKSGETDFLIKNGISAKNNGIKLISFTGDSENTLGKISDINFKIYDMHTMDDRNKLSNSFFPNILMLFEFLIGEYLEKIE